MKQIFVVEDDHDIRELITFLLMSQNYEVKGFANAESFQKTILSEKPDLVLLDVMLPDGNGQELCVRLHQEKITGEIPVVLMSAHVEEVGCQYARDFIRKPFDVEDFLERVERHVAS